MSLMSEVEQFKKETGIKDEKTDAVIANAYSFGSGLCGIDMGMNVTTTAKDSDETVDLSWIAAFAEAAATIYGKKVRAEIKDVVKDMQDEDIYDSTWRAAPEALPAHEEESEGE